MSVFNIYNVQLLPLNEDHHEVGVKGYRRLFAGLRDLTEVHKSGGTQIDFHYQIGESFIAPAKFRFPAGRVEGFFTKYKPTEILFQQGRNDKVMFKAKVGKVAVDKEELLPFVFNPSRHYLAIAVNGMNAEPVRLALEKFFLPVAEAAFPNHTLQITTISRANDIESVLENAIAYSNVALKVTFPNSDYTKGIFKELKDNKTQDVEVHVSAGSKGRMPGLPQFLIDLLRASVTLGTAKVVYFVESLGNPGGIKKTYNSLNAPLNFTARMSATDEENPERFFDRVTEKLSDIDVNQSDVGVRIQIEDHSEDDQDNSGQIN